MPASLKRLLISTITVVGGVYLVLSVYLYTRQTDFIFFPAREITSTPQDDGCAYSDVHIPVGEGQLLHGWWLSAPATATAPIVDSKGNGRTLLYLHGNGGNVGANSEHACRLNRMGFSVLIFDYRGYGQSSGPPGGLFGGKINERTVYADGEAAWQYLTAPKQVVPGERGASAGCAQAKREAEAAQRCGGLESKDIVLYGHSLGGAVAIELAKRHPDAGALIVESTFTSLLDMANKDPVFQYFPVSLVLDQKMESEEKLRGIRMPLLVIHGADDSMIPPTMAEKLHAAAGTAPGRKQLYIAPRADHGDVAATSGPAYGQRIAAFLRAAGAEQANVEQ